jgi:hypothetical protein
LYWEDSWVVTRLTELKSYPSAVHARLVERIVSAEYS